MNQDVRDEFYGLNGFDPIELFQSPNPDPARLRAFLDYRADLARRQQEKWIGEIESIRAAKPDLDFVLTHVDDRFDTRMRDLIGADASRVLPLLDQHDFTFLIEDPATIWNLGPQRYPQIAARYQPLTQAYRPPGHRYQHRRALSGRLSHQTTDRNGIVPAGPRGRAGFSPGRLVLREFHPQRRPASARLRCCYRHFQYGQSRANGARLIVDSRQGVGVSWQGPALVNGHLWPVRNDTTLWLPAGTSVIEPAPQDSSLRIVDFNGDLRSANASAQALQFTYQSNARALALLNARPRKIEIDGAIDGDKLVESGAGFVLTLPRGQHIVQLTQ